MKRAQSPSQTVGPFFAYGLTPEQYGYRHISVARERVCQPDTDGQWIHIEGRVLDGKGEPVNDAIVEIWQADARGRYAHPDVSHGANSEFFGFGRAGTGTDPHNRFQFQTVKPGAIGSGHAPHISVIVFARGLANHLYTRIYFDDEAVANTTDEVLCTLPEDRRHTLLAVRVENTTPPLFRFDVRLQGDDETVFFDV